jgi:hypothetical protein
MAKESWDKTVGVLCFANWSHVSGRNLWVGFTYHLNRMTRSTEVKTMFMVEEGDEPMVGRKWQDPAADRKLLDAPWDMLSIDSIGITLANFLFSRDRAEFEIHRLGSDFCKIVVAREVQG